jgi:pimeloyl-ACP methyl ester carboxylesterase
MALCSMGISFYITNHEPYGNDPKWVKILTNEAKIHPEWVQQLRDSPIANFTDSVPKVGVVIDVHQCKWLGHLPRLIRAHIPIWFVWSTLDKPLRTSPQPEVAKYLPNSAQVQAALQQWELEQLPPTPSGPTVDVTSSPKFPQPNPGSRQKYGETWQEFFV